MKSPSPLRRASADKVKIALVNAAGRTLFDRRLGTLTEGRVELVDLGVAADFRAEYQPSAWRTLPRVLRTSEVNSADVFIDFGCGMGRVVLDAAMRYRMARVIGVELSDELVEIARKNVDRNRRRLRTRDIEIVASDVLDYQIPDDVTITYFYNPFVGPVFSKVIEGLIASVDRAPRRLRIIYHHPTEEWRLAATGRVRRTGYGRSLLGRERPGNAGLRVYEVVPADGGQ